MAMESNKMGREAETQLRDNINVAMEARNLAEGRYRREEWGLEERAEAVKLCFIYIYI
jgi:hypothetical protein